MVLTKAEQRIYSYVRQPELFIEEQLQLRLWSGMRQIIDSVWDNQRTSVRACHGISKTVTGAAVAVTFLNLFPNSVVITTAPTTRQVRLLLWKEISACYQRAGRGLLGRALMQEVKVAPEWYMIGFSTDLTAGIEGFHAPYILWVLDEAKGLPYWLYNSIEGSFTGGFVRVLEVSTTDGADEQCMFRVHHTAQRSQWSCIHLSAMDSPFVAPEDFAQERGRIHDELYEYGKPKQGPEWPPGLAASIQVATPIWVQDRIEAWGEGDPEALRTKVWGEFAEESTNAVIPMAWLAAAVGAHVEPSGEGRRNGLDVARYGDDRTVLTPYDNGTVLEQHTWRKISTMETVGRARQISAGGLIQVDAIGEGAGVYDRLDELGYPAIGIISSAKSNEPNRFVNFRAELWWRARELFRRQYEDGNVVSIPNDPELIEELSGVKYHTRSDGRYIIEQKDAFKKRLGRSPDKGDSCVYALYRFEDEVIPQEAFFEDGSEVSL